MMPTRKPTSQTVANAKKKKVRVKCYTCGSLFSTDAPDCEAFNKFDKNQEKVCKPDEACLYYSWTIQGKTSVIRECFPTTILLGTIEEPIEPADECEPVSVESNNIKACICTTDLCTGIGDDSVDQHTQVTTTRRPAPTTRSPGPRKFNSDSDRVRCHQCGTLFSTPSSNPNCKEFDDRDPLQNIYCQPGEACLWYSWKKSAGNSAVIRECISRDVLLGTIENPLVLKPFCEPQDVSENNLATVTACLCDSDLCNSYRSSGEKGREIFPVHTLQQIPALPLSQSSGRERNSNGREFGDAPEETPRRVQNVPQRRDPPGIAANNNAVSQEFPSRRKQSFHPDKVGLQCYACGSLLNQNNKCHGFNRTDPSQVQTCLTDEACLMYSWKKSPTKIATLRECFPIRVLLGTLDDPLVPVADCSQKDITDDKSGTIFACLCNTDFCNDDPNSQFVRGLTDKRRPTTRRPTRKLRPASTPSVKNKPFRTRCPKGLELIDGGCYFFSKRRVGWIEAKKLCEEDNSQLLSLETESKKAAILEHIVAKRRRRLEYWLAGNDIDEEEVWEWAKVRTPVGSWGWLDEPYRSTEENCLSWTISSDRRRGLQPTEGWHGSSCCNNLKFICQLL